MLTTTTGPRIYVACLASYNSGILHGRWIDADQSAEEIMDDIQDMLIESSVPDAEEWAIHDYDEFYGLSIEESEDIEKVAELAALITEHGEAYAAYADHVGSDYASPQGFEDTYRGQWDSERAYAEELFDECYLHDVPDHLRFYVDYDAFARDLFIDSCVSVDASDGGVFVFDR